jgi:ribonuclease HI
MKHIKIYTDGSSLGNPGDGGWGGLLIYGDKFKEISGYVPNATNNQMEIMAVIESLSCLKFPCDIDIYTDSQYVKNGITLWILNWIQNNWKGSNKKPIKNQELWMKLYDIIQKSGHKINWHWVKGHGSDINNNRVDLIARAAATNKNASNIMDI